MYCVMYLYLYMYFSYIVTLGGHVLRQPAAAVIPVLSTYLEVVAGPCRDKPLRWSQSVRDSVGRLQNRSVRVGRRNVSGTVCPKVTVSGFELQDIVRRFALSRAFTFGDT